MADPPFNHELQRYWDAVLRGDPDASRDPDPALTDMIRRLHAVDRVPPPDPARMRQIREELMTTQIGEIGIRASRLTFPINGVVPPPWQPFPPARPAPRQRGRGTAALLATALLLLITLTGMYLTAQSDNRSAFGPGGRPAVGVESTLDCGSAPDRGSTVTSSPLAYRWATPGAGDGPPVTLTWVTTGTPDQLQAAAHMAFDPQCRLWVADQIGNRFFLFDEDGGLLEVWGEAGSGPGQFNLLGRYGDPASGGLAFAEDGGFYVADTGNDRIQQFDADRRFVRAWGAEGGMDGQFANPIFVGIGPDGNVYVVDDQRDDVQAFTAEGRFLFKFGSNLPGSPGQLSWPASLDFDPSGNIWVVDIAGSSIVQFSATGVPVGPMPVGTLVPNPTGLVIDDDGNFFVTSLKRGYVVVLDPTGELIFTWGERGFGDGQFLEPVSVLLDGHGGVYVAQTGAASVEGSGRVQKFQLQPPFWLDGADPEEDSSAGS